MDSLSVDELAQKNDRWYRIVEEMLAEAGVAINGPQIGRASCRERV